MNPSSKQRPDLNYFSDGIHQGDRIILSQAITLIESHLEEDHQLADALLEKVIHNTGRAFRIGITGAPGVGKSTFIEALGHQVTREQKKLAVLTVDPSSPLTGGSILGDKTRMEALSKNPLAFIRPTPSARALGGVARKTREAMLLCEAAGYDIIMIETVGVGQSEVAVKGMVDFFLLLMLAGAGDELQGIKKGIVEIADAIIISKADGENTQPAQRAQAMYQHALHLLSTPKSGWIPQVLTSSVSQENSIITLWDLAKQYKQQMESSGFFQANRSRQNLSWFRDTFALLLQRDIQQSSFLESRQKALEEAVTNRTLTVNAAARQLLDAFHHMVRERNA